MAPIVSKLGTLDKIAEKLSLVDDLCKRVEALEARMASSSSAASAWSTGPPSTSGGTAVAGSAFKLQKGDDNRQHDPRARRASSMPAPPTSNPNILWLSGAGRPLLAQQWTEIGRRILREHLSAELADQTIVKGLNMQDRCKLEFPTDLDCRNFQNSFLGTPSTWDDPRTSKSQQLRIRRDQSLPERDFGRFMGTIWALVDTAIRAKHDNSFPPQTRLGTSGSQVILYSTASAIPDPYVLLVCKTDREKDLTRMRPEAWYDNCHHWGLDRACMDDIVSKALEIARSKDF